MLRDFVDSLLEYFDVFCLLVLCAGVFYQRLLGENRVLFDQLLLWDPRLLCRRLLQAAWLQLLVLFGLPEPCDRFLFFLMQCGLPLCGLGAYQVQRNGVLIELVNSFLNQCEEVRVGLGRFCLRLFAAYVKRK